MVSSRRCSACGSRGHNCRTCPELVAGDSTVTLKAKKKTACGWCTEIGHNIRTCPNKKHSAVKLAELQPLLEEHVSNILLKAGIGRGTLVDIRGYRNLGKGIVTGFSLEKQHYFGGVNVFHVEEPEIQVTFPSGDYSSAWIPILPEDAIAELVKDLNHEYRDGVRSRLHNWGYSTHTVICKSSTPLKLTNKLKVQRGQTLVGLKEWKKNLTAHLANVKKSEDSEKTVENP